MATITTRVDDDLKKQAKELADKLGFSLSTLVNVWLKDFIRTKKVSVGLTEDDYEYYVNNPDYIEVDEPIEVFHDYLAKLVKEDEQTTRKVS